MKTVKLFLTVLALIFASGAAEAQFLKKLGNVAKDAAERATERTVERKAEQKTEAVVGKSIDKATDLDTYKSEGSDVKESDNVKVVKEKQAETVAPKTPVRKVDLSAFTANDIWFPVKSGTVQVFAHKNAKGKIDSQSRTTIKDVSGQGANFTISYTTEILDENGASLKEPMVVDYSLVVTDGVMTFDMKGAFGSMKGMESVEVTGSPQQIPADLQVGEKIEDSNMSVKISIMTMKCNITDAVCEAIEDVTVGAGTFKAYRVSQNVTVSMGGGKSRQVIWYAKGAGAVKTELYDKKGKLQSSDELISMN